MKCYTCNRLYTEYKGALSLHSDIIGDYTVYDVLYYKCDNCYQLLLPKDTVKKIESTEIDIQYNIVRQLPINEFITASEAVKLLGISKQAFHKHRRIKKGFIYYVTLSDKQLYHKKSVLLFKKTGDGRFNLYNQHSKEIVKYVLIPIHGNHYHQYIKNIEEIRRHFWIKKEVDTNKNSNYYLNLNGYNI
jgi:hypothetical protein